MELAGLHEKLYKAEVGLREALGRRDAAHEAVQALEGQVAALQEEERLVVARLQPARRPQPAGGDGGLLLTAVWADQESEDDEKLVRNSTVATGHQSEAGPRFSQTLSDIAEEPEVKRQKMTRGDAFDELKAKKGYQVKEVAENILQRMMNIEDIGDMTQETLNLFEVAVEKTRMKLNKLKKDFEKKKKKDVDRRDETFLSTSVFEDLQEKLNKTEDLEDVAMENERRMDQSEEEEREGREEKVGRTRTFYKAFTELAPRSNELRARSDPLLAEVRKWCELNRVELVHAVGYLLHRQYYLGQEVESDRQLAALGWALFRGGRAVNLVAEVPHHSGLWMVERLRLGRGRYTDVRLLLLQHVRLPPYQHLSDLRLSLCPPIRTYPLGAPAAEQCGVCCDLTEALVLVLLQGLRSWEPGSWLPSCSTSGRCTNLVVRVLGSADGRGDEKQHAQRSQVTISTTHAFSLVFSMPSIHQAAPPEGETHIPPWQ
jgi:hypothetical protein